MSNKDILDRLAHTPAKSAPKPGEVKGSPEPRANEQRVSSGVVRRRPAAAPPEPPPPPVAATPKTIRRPGAGERPPVREEPVAARPATPPPAAVPGTLRRPAVREVPPVAPTRPEAVARPAVTEAPPSPVEAPAPEATAVPAPEVEVVPPPAAVEAAPAPVAEAPAPEAAPAPAPEVAAAPAPEPEAAPEPVEAPPAAAAAPAPAPAPVAEPVKAEPTLERAVIIDRPGGTARHAPAVQAAPPSAQRSAAGPQGRLPDAPILPGLGRAVVSLPAGYDPTDPTGARRRAREQAAAGPRWGGAGPGDRGPRPPMGSGPRPGEAPAGEDRGRGKKGRRGERSEHVMSDLGGDRFRRAKKGGKDLRPSQPAKAVKRKARIEGEITVANLAHELGMKAADVIKFLMSMGTPATVNQSIDFDTATLIAQEFGHEVVNVAFDESAHLIQSAEEDLSGLPERAPVVTVMGHVDHGKTTLLDTIRKAKVAAGEAGGITQHIGAYQVKRGDRPITFIDTPGHAAFSAMRARGAKATDIVILVVAADDGVMPQTIEAINHAKAARVPILVAINKMDKPGVNPERLKQELMTHGLVPEEFGGDTMMIPVSALKGTGVDDLLDSVLLIAEVQDLHANPDRHAEGVVLESRLEVGRGAVATLLVQTGTLKQGDTLVIGSTWGRVRAMSDDRGAKVKEAGPSTPVEIMGLQDVPAAGDEFVVVGSEKDARVLVEHRQQAVRQAALGQRARLTVEDLYKAGGGEASPIQHIVLKADVSGSLEALKGALEGMVVAGTQLKILHAAIGPINESDINLAAGNNAFVVAFGVKTDAKARQAADQFGVEIKRYDIIYNVLDDVKARLEGMLEPIYEEQKVGEAEVRAVFKIPKIGVIAGCMVLDGKVQRGLAAKVYRDGKELYDGKVTSLKRFKEDVKEVEKGFECGIGVEGADVQVGDRITIFQRVQVPRS